MEKINIAEILKDCPKGMELDCAMYDNCTYEGIEDNGYIDILINTPSGQMRLTKEGCYIRHDDNAKCVIFPKGKTTWEGFVPPCEFKDGDICYIKTESFEHIFIFKVNEDSNLIQKYVNLSEKHFYTDERPVCSIDDVKEIRLATEEEKAKLFDAIKSHGYKWNPETKTLKKLVEPKFKVGDKIKYKNGKNIDGVEQGVILSITDEVYDVAVTNNMGVYVSIAEQDDWELVPNKFDINTLKPFDKVLVRHNKDNKWCGSFFSHIDKDLHSHCSKFVTIAGKSYPMCIPYEKNEHLLGTTNDCDEYYKIW